MIASASTPIGVVIASISTRYRRGNSLLITNELSNNTGYRDGNVVEA